MRSHISFFYGPSAWDEIVAIEAKMRKERREAVYAAEERKQAILEWVVGLTAGAVGLGILGAVIYFIGLSNGSW